MSESGSWLEQGSLPQRPLLAPWYRVAPTDTGLALEYRDSIIAFEGAAARRLLPRLVPLLDGTRTVAEIVGALAAPSAEAALRRLAAEGLLVEGGAAPEAACFHAAASPVPVGPAAVADRLRGVTVAIAGGGATASELERLLTASGIGTVRRVTLDAAVGDPTLAVAAPAPAELPLLPGWNSHMLERSAPWLQALPHNGRFAAIGPLYLPGETCCYECFRRRRAAALGGPGELDALDATPAAYPVSPGIAASVAGIAATLALAWLVAPEGVAAGVLYALELGMTARLDAHRVYRLPRCPVCSPSAELPAPLPWALEEAG